LNFWKKETDKCEYGGHGADNSALWGLHRKGET